jgi:hypothetical protein
LRRHVLPPLVVLLVLAAAVPALAYLKLGIRVNDRTVTLRWTTQPVRYYVSERSAPGVSAQDFQTVVSRAFATWSAVDTAQTSSEFAGFTQAPPEIGDSMTVLGFANRPDLQRVLGATSFIVDTTDGAIVESDIFFNTAFPWSVAPAGEPGRHDLEAIAVHEIGHLLGLGHSAIGETEVVPGGRRVLGAEAVMFPIAFASGSIVGRTLKADDIAGLTDIYPTPASRRSRGSISGRVTKGGAGVRGAHVVAFNPRTGSLVGGFTLNDDGSFTIAGLEAGPHVLRVEPLDDGDVESFFDRSFTVDLDFRVRFHDRIVIVPQGGGARNVEVAVSPR